VAALSLSALRKQIADRKLASLYVFVGEDVKLVDRMVDAIESVIDPGSGSLQADSGPTGTGLVVPVDGSPIDLSGLRSAGGGVCDKVVGVRRTPGALVWIDLNNC